MAAARSAAKPAGSIVGTSASSMMASAAAASRLAKPSRSTKLAIERSTNGSLLAQQFVFLKIAQEAREVVEPARQRELGTGRQDRRTTAAAAPGARRRGRARRPLGSGRSNAATVAGTRCPQAGRSRRRTAGPGPAAVPTPARRERTQAPGPTPNSSACAPGCRARNASGDVPLSANIDRNQPGGRVRKLALRQYGVPVLTYVQMTEREEAYLPVLSGSLIPCGLRCGTVNHREVASDRGPENAFRDCGRIFDLFHHEAQPDRRGGRMCRTIPAMFQLADYANRFIPCMGYAASIPTSTAACAGRQATLKRRRHSASAQGVPGLWLVHCEEGAGHARTIRPVALVRPDGWQNCARP